MKQVTHEGVRFFASNGDIVAEVRVETLTTGRLNAAEVFKDDALIILIGERLRLAGVIDVLGRHTLWYSDGSSDPGSRGW